MVDETSNKQYDDSSSEDDIICSDPSKKQMREELQIRVQNFEKNTVVMWTLP